MDSDDDVSMNMSGNVSGMMEESMNTSSVVMDGSTIPNYVMQESSVPSNHDSPTSGLIARPPHLEGSLDNSVLDTSIAFSFGPNNSFQDVLELTIPALPPPSMQHDQLLRVAYKCQRRGLTQTTKWLLELASSLHFLPEDSVEVPINNDMDDLPTVELVQYMLAKTYFDMNEFQRAAHALKECTSTCSIFLRLYSKYLAGERLREEEEPDPLKDQKRNVNPELTAIRKELKSLIVSGCRDPFILYLMGLVMRDLGLELKAKEAFIETVSAEPLLWCGWVELTNLCSNKSQVNDLCSVVPVHWVRHHFHALAALELYAPEAVSMFEILCASYPTSAWLASNCALARYNIRDYEVADEVFTQLREKEPYRLESVDAYSNILYVQESKETQLSQLARDVIKVDKYRVETCCVLGNYYSCKGAHEKAIVYFQRALQLNRKYLSAWTLLGHEYLEVKNTKAAVAAYRRAVDVNQRDYRAWYGLGQAYELMHLSLFSIYYFKRALQLRPYDTRMWEAVGSVLQSHKRYDEAIRCFENLKPLQEGEGVSSRNVVSTLAYLYKLTQQREKARKCYESLIERDESGKILVSDPITLDACLFLSTYFLEKGDAGQVNIYANTLMSAGEKYTHHARHVLEQLERRGSDGERGVSPQATRLRSVLNRMSPGLFDSIFYDQEEEEYEPHDVDESDVNDEDDNDILLDLSD
eukprot:m.104278 g.104278  ORF g.104278 m.104278 type:complete len:697 (-) comp9108_c0_seq5:2051-4141(-)